MEYVLRFVFFMFLNYCLVAGNEDEFRKIDAVKPEPPCLQAGGICTIATDCPAGHLSETRGLCPQQRSSGIECCHGLSIKETRCQKHGGQCYASSHYCNPRIVYHEATDCPGDNKCCIMIN